MNWAQLQQNSDYRSIKERLSLAAVIQVLGTPLQQSGDRLVGLCPFHNDSSPSFAVWKTEDGDELCGCWSCDFRPSDVFTFIERRLNLTFSQAAKVALAYINDGIPEAPPLPEREYDFAASKTAVAEAVEPTHAVYQFLADRDLPILDSWLVAEFRVGVNRDGDIIVPHFGRDGELHAAKKRRGTGKPITIPGGRLDALYGEWRDRNRKDVILCEGESDTWFVAWLHRDKDVDVLGLPSGVSSKPKAAWVDALRNRNVTLLFDGDDAGRRGAASWALELNGVADSIRVASLADGHDACSSGETVLETAVRKALPYRDLGSLAVTEQDSHYVKINTATGAGTDLSDFVFDLRSTTDLVDGSIYFDVLAGDEQHQLSTATLSNSNLFRKWCMDRMLSWKGSSREAAELFERLKAYAVFTPRYQGTDVTGLHDGTFVLPDGGRIGSGVWMYVGEGQTVKAEDQIKIHPGPLNREIVRYLSLMHEAKIMTPLLGWVAASPLRSMCSQFPILAVVGGAGFGKTTLVQATLRSFNFWCASPMTLSSTTPHAVQSFVASTNAFPVWFDEYRYGARPDAKSALDQAIRDAWDGSSSVKGGYGENRVALKYLAATAPIVITGEDAFSETSHAERMIILSIGPQGRNANALAAVEQTVCEGLGYDYLAWLTQRVRQDDFPAPPREHDRHTQARAVCEWGYGLLNEYASGTLPPFDFSLAEVEYESMAANTPYLELLRGGLELRDQQGAELVWIDVDDLCVRRRALLAAVKRAGLEFHLPGGERAFGKWLQQYFETVEGLRDHRGAYTLYKGAAQYI